MARKSSKNKRLALRKANVNKNTNNYSVSLDNDVTKVNIEALRNSNKSSIVYKIDGNVVNNLNNIMKNENLNAADWNMHKIY